MGKVAYIIPGFLENTRQKRYKKVIEYFKSKGINPIHVKISWKNKTMTDYVNQFLSTHKKTKGDVYLFGFSFGAMIAFISAARVKASGLFLCSLSPYFKEDLVYLKKSWKKMIGRKRVDDFKKYSFNELAKKVGCKTFILAGSKECKKHPNLERRIKAANKKIKGSELVLIPNAKHDISQKEYLYALKNVISGL